MSAETIPKLPDLSEIEALFPEVPVAYAHLDNASLRRMALCFAWLGKPGFRRYVMPYIRPSWGSWPLVAQYLRPRLFQYFCGGESKKDCAVVIDRLRSHDIYSILDPAAEDAHTEEAFAAHSTEIAQTLQESATQEAIAFAALKPSALGDTHIMTKKAQGLTLSPEEKSSLRAFEVRLQRLCQAAHQQQVPLLIDAEEYAPQAYIDPQVMQLSAQYNKTWACIYNTFQLYCKDGYLRLKHMHQQALSQGFILGAKLVRGAYMEKERKLAKAQKRPSPIHETKAACDNAYNHALLYVLKHLKSCALFAGTHNPASCALLHQEIKARKLPLDHPHICLSQLYGMGEALSYGLAKRGLRVAKYIPYGPYKQLLPYLYRRALENSALQGQSHREKEALTQELQRRKQSLSP